MFSLYGSIIHTMLKSLKFLGKLVLLIIILYWAHGLVINPRLDRDWTDDQKILPTIEFKGNNIVTIKNIRNISYRTTSDYDLNYYDKTINIDDLESVWYLVEPFGNFGAAHTLVSFGLSDGSYIAVSVEIRKEKGESFSALKGILRRYELVYVIADENDVIKLRTNYRKDQVRLYPIKADKEKTKAVFINMLERANELNKEPEFYNTITNNCTTNIVKHVRRFSDKDIPWYDLRYLMPENSDEVVYKVGMIDTNLSLEQARIEFNITKTAQNCSPSKDFSACIREPMRDKGQSFVNFTKTPPLD